MPTGQVFVLDLVEIEHRTSDGKVKSRYIAIDALTNVGKAQIAGLINGVVTTPFKYIAIGTGTTAASSSDTALENETHRALGTTSRETTNVSNDTAVVQATFSGGWASGGEDISESGLFDASTGGNMLCRDTFTARHLEGDDELTVTWKVVVTEA